MSTRVLSSGFSVSEVLSRNVMVLENIERERKDLPNDEAVYLVAPTESSVNRIVNDFDGRPKYKAVHIFFLEACSSDLFKKISNCKILASRIKTLKEVDLAFIPYESRVFSLDIPDALGDFHGSGRHLEAMANHLVTVCSLLEEYPSVRYLSGGRKIHEFAELVQHKLDQYKAEVPSLGSGRGKDKSELIILERGFDLVSPLVHEITYQAMVYDVLDIEQDLYVYKQQSLAGERERKVALNEEDPIWDTLRHLPINEAAEKIRHDFDEFLKKRKMMKKAMSKAGGKESEVKDMSRLLKEYPQYQRALNEHSLHVNLADSCNKKLDREGVVHLCEVEQDLVMKTTGKGEPLLQKNAVPSVYDILFPKKKGEAAEDRTYSNYDKFRVLALYALYSEGISEEDFKKFSEYASLPKDLKQALLNMQEIGGTILRDKKRGSGPSLKRIPRRAEDMYTIARWVPVAKDIIEYAMNGQLSESYCPFLTDRPRQRQSASGSSRSGATESVKWNWRGGPTQAKPESRQQGEGSLIIYIIGGVTYSEMRAVYEVAKEKTDREIYIGGSSILTPQVFIDHLKLLHLA
jgi:hypothetical protein